MCVATNVLQRRGICQVHPSSPLCKCLRTGNHQRRCLGVQSIWSQFNVAHEGPQISWISGALRWWHLCVATRAAAMEFGLKTKCTLQVPWNCMRSENFPAVECAMRSPHKTCRTRRSPNQLDKWGTPMVAFVCCHQRAASHGIWTEDQVHPSSPLELHAIREGVLSVSLDAIWSQNVRTRRSPDQLDKWGTQMVAFVCCHQRAASHGIWTEDQVHPSNLLELHAIREGVLSVHLGCRSPHKMFAHEGPQISWISGALRWWHLCVATNVLHHHGICQVHPSSPSIKCLRTGIIREGVLSVQFDLVTIQRRTRRSPDQLDKWGTPMVAFACCHQRAATPWNLD